MLHGNDQTPNIASVALFTLAASIGVVCACAKKEVFWELPPEHKQAMALLADLRESPVSALLCQSTRTALTAARRSKRTSLRAKGQVTAFFKLLLCHCIAGTSCSS
jgi:hypothetical protein